MTTPISSVCPVSYALELFGDRWTLLVLRDILLEDRHSFGTILAAHPGLATSVLANRLKRLVLRGLIVRCRDQRDARQSVYRPTPLAASVVPMLLEMMVWGARQGNASIDADLLHRFESDRQALVDELKMQILDRAHDPG